MPRLLPLASHATLFLQLESKLCVCGMSLFGYNRATDNLYFCQTWEYDSMVQ